MSISWSDIRSTPTLTEEQVLFTSGSTVTINAPAQKVFDIITDFDKYGEWNTWSPKFVFKEGERIEAGATGIMHCRMEAQKKDYEIPEKILALERNPEKYRIAWRGMLLPSWAGTAERVQEVKPTEDGKACIITQWQSMAGWAAYPFKYLMGIPKQLDEANIKYCNELKAYAEKKHAVNA